MPPDAIPHHILLQDRRQPIVELISDLEVPDAPMLPWDFFAGRDTDYAVDVSFAMDTTPPINLFEYSPEIGTLHNQHPSGMFTDTSIIWIERIRMRESGSQTLHLHRGASVVNFRIFISTLGNDAAVYVISLTDKSYVCIDATSPTSLSGTGNGFIEWNARDIEDAILHPSGTDWVTFIGTLSMDHAVVALSTQRDYVPNFG